MKKVISILSGMIFMVGTCVHAFGETEPNDNFKTSNAVAVPGTITGAIQVINDFDYYSLVTTQGGVIEVTVSNVPSNIEISITAYDADTLNSIGTVNGIQAQVTKLQLVAPAGTYYLMIHDKGNNESNNGQYTLEVKLNTYDPCETNNTFSTACQIPQNVSLQAQIWGTNSNNIEHNDWDIYKIQTNHAGVLTLSITVVPAELEMQITAFAESDTNTAIGYAAGPPATLTILPLVVPEGTYYIKINDGNDNETSPDAYTLTSSLDITDECEFNNTFSTACPIAENSTFKGKISGIYLPLPEYSDQDYYQLQTSKAGVLKVQIDSVPQYLEMEISAFAEADTFNALKTVTGLEGQPATFEGVMAAGSYYLKINDHNNNESSADAYTVTVSLDTTDGCELNNTIATACTLPLCDTLNAVLYPAADTDYYSFTGNGLPIILKAMNVSPGGAVKITAFDNSSTQIGVPVQGTTGQPVTMTINTINGEMYYAGLEASGADQVSYEFAVGDTSCFLSNGISNQASRYGIQIYPNPASAALTVAWYGTGGIYSVTINDLTGKELLHSGANLNDHAVHFDLTHLPAGMFIVQLKGKLGELLSSAEFLKAE